MGYYIFQEDSEFHVDNKHVGDLVLAVHRLYLDNDLSYYMNDDIIKINDVVEIFRIFSWDIEQNETGDIVDINFQGEKSGCEDKLFATIAPFVKNDCYIQMRGEDHELWRWSFCNGVMTKQTPTITWE
jgi:hypothetical protein